MTTAPRNYQPVRPLPPMPTTRSWIESYTPPATHRGKWVEITAPIDTAADDAVASDDEQEVAA